MGVASEQIRVSEAVKRRLDRRRRPGESYNDVLERLLSGAGDADFHDGFGMLSDGQAGWIRKRRETAREERKRRTRRQEDR